MRFLIRVLHHLLEQRKIHQRLAAKEGDVDRMASHGILKQVIHRLLGHIPAHELGLAVRRGDLVFAELVAVATAQIALIGEVQHHRLQWKVRGGEVLWRILFRRVAFENRAKLGELFDRLADLRSAKGQCADQLFGRSGLRPHMVEHRSRNRVEVDDAAARHEIQKPLSGGLEAMHVTRCIGHSAISG